MNNTICDHKCMLFWTSTWPPKTQIIILQKHFLRQIYTQDSHISNLNIWKRYGSSILKYGILSRCRAKQWLALKNFLQKKTKAQHVFFIQSDIYKLYSGFHKIMDMRNYQFTAISFERTGYIIIDSRL